MSRLGPTSSSFFAPLALGLGFSAGGRALIEVIGPSPIHLFAALGSFALALLAGRRSSPVLDHRSWSIGLLLLPGLILLGLDDLLRAWGTLALEVGLRPEHGLVCIMGAWSASLIPWTRIYQARGRPDAPWSSPLLSVGAMAGLWFNPNTGLLIATGTLACLRWACLPSAERSGSPRWNFARVPALTLSVAASAALWLALRGSIDPTLSGAIVFAAMGMLTIPLGQRLAPKGAFDALLLSAAWAMLSILLLRFLGRWTRELLLLSVADAGPIPGLWAIWSSSAMLGLVCGLVAGLALGSSPGAIPARGRALGLIIGLLALPWLQHEGNLGLVAGTAGALAFLLSARRLSQAIGLILAVSAGLASMLIPQYPVANQSLAPESSPSTWMVDLSQGQFRLLQRFEDLERDGAWRIDRIPSSMQWGLHGTGSTWVQTSEWSTRPDDGTEPSLALEQEGLLSWTRGREAKAEFLAGLLGSALSPSLDRSLILGDPTGRALMGLKAARPEGAMGSVILALPQTGPLAQIEVFDSGLAQALTPFETVIRAHPDYVLRIQPRLDLLVEVVRAPWQDGTGLTLTPSHIRSAASRLGDQGVFVSAVHLRWFDRGTPEALAALLSEHFAHVQIWLPPEGADSLLLVGSQAPISLVRLSTRLSEESQGLEMLGMPDSMALAAHALGDRQSALLWGAKATVQPTDRLGARVFELYQPHWHTLGLNPFKRPVDDIWSLEDSTDELSSAQQASVLVYRETVELFLANLIEEASGNPAASHLLSQELDRRDDPLAQQKLSELISRHLELARKRIEQAYATGDPRAWTDAHALSESAHRRAPGETEPLILLGEILMAQGQLSTARQKYDKVLELDSNNKNAHWGLARVARERHDFLEAEDHLREAIRLHPRDWTCWQQLGIFLVEQARPEEAADVLSRASSLSDGEHPRPYLGLAQAQLDLGKADQALATANRAIHLGGGAYALYLRGRAYMDLEQLDRSEADFRGAILANPDLVEARGGLGLIRARQGDYAAAAEAFRGVLRVDPNNVAARENLRQAEERLRDGQPPEGP